MKIGLFGARCDNGGLANQTWEFYKYFKPEKTVLITGLTDREDNLDMFPNAIKTTMPIDTSLVDDFLEGLDIVFCIETPYTYYLFKKAKEMGVKTVLQYNYEFLDYFEDPSLPYPDLLLAPSKWHLQDVIDTFGGAAKIDYLPVPVNRTVLPPMEKTSIKTFIHIAGVKLHEDRNGTDIVLDSLKYIKSSIRFIIYSQHPIDREIVSGKNVRLKIKEMNVKNYWDLYDKGDCLVLPRRYGGLSLQLNEAMSRGMIPIVPNCGPQNTFLDPMMITPVNGCKKIKLRPAKEIDCYSINPISLATHIDIMANMGKDRVLNLSSMSSLYATLISWQNLGPKYYRLFEDLCQK